MDRKLTFTLEKETKGTVKYQEDGHAPIVGTLYIRKGAFETADYPRSVAVELKFPPKGK